MQPATMSYLTRPLALLTLLIALCTTTLVPAAGAAPRSPSLDRKHVCDWTFVAGPRQGQSGKETRRWLGSLPTLQESTWWPGKTGNSTDTLTSPVAVPGETATTRWNVTSKFSGNTASGKLDVSETIYRYARSQRVIYHDLTNGAYVSCLELSPSALGWIHTTYGDDEDPSNPCNCGNAYHYDATIACLERCTTAWDDNDRWARLAPPCLRGDSIVAKVACLLSRDPSVGGIQEPGDNPDLCKNFPSLPECKSSGGGEGAECGTERNPYCRPECVCRADNTCRCPPGWEDPRG